MPKASSLLVGQAQSKGKETILKHLSFGQIHLTHDGSGGRLWTMRTEKRSVPMLNTSNYKSNN